MTTTASTPTSAPVTGWDRAVVIALGAAGCALSYDALQQMATAIHVRGFLTYLFPLVVDGFIAYGVRALLVMREAPLRARAYVWLLFGSATTASLWANALHAVRLNQLHAADGGLRLGDTVVAALSTIAPLALAGAVHLYILIARGPVTSADRDSRNDRVAEVGPGQSGVLAAQDDRPVSTTRTAESRAAVGHHGAGQPGGAPPVSRSAPTGQPVSSLQRAVPVTPESVTEVRPVNLTKAAELGGHPDNALPVSDRPAPAGPVTAPEVSHLAPAVQPVIGPRVTDRADRGTGDRRADPDTEELLGIARKAVKAEDKLTRKVVAQAIRGQQIPLSSDTLTQLMAQLRAQHGQPVTVDRD
ncbi:DUF2637 domain-containing protein [Kitasatospora sp. NPDC056181]|uniref:DUF2637 domain-containing protein n=1 Tax=Kitasatospora sp. NPDC056181 TaxID=3345737 RepID=UPI0035DBEFA9